MLRGVGTPELRSSRSSWSSGGRGRCGDRCGPGQASHPKTKPLDPVPAAQWSRILSLLPFIQLPLGRRLGGSSLLRRPGWAHSAGCPPALSEPWFLRLLNGLTPIPSGAAGWWEERRPRRTSQCVATLVSVTCHHGHLSPWNVGLGNDVRGSCLPAVHQMAQPLFTSPLTR